MEDRIVELELRFMQQQELLEQLSDVVAAQQKEIDRLARELRTTKEYLGTEPWREGGAPADEKPPHW